MQLRQKDVVLICRPSHISLLLLAVITCLYSTTTSLRRLVKKWQQTGTTHDARNQIKFIINTPTRGAETTDGMKPGFLLLFFFHDVILFDTLIPLNWRNIGMKAHLVIHPVSIYVFKMLAWSVPLGPLTQHESQGFKKGETMTAAVMFIPHFLSN